MSSWHISTNTGEPARCSAEKGNCPYGGDHYSTFEEAQEAFENSMGDSLFATVQKAFKHPRMRKIAKVGASIGVALISTVGISDISHAREPAFFGDLDGIMEESGDIFNDALGEIENALGIDVNDLADKATDWLDQDSVKNSPVNKKAEEIVDRVPGYQRFKNFIQDWGSPKTTVKDDGSILWQGKPLEASDVEIKEAQEKLNSLKIMPERTGGYDREALFGANKDSTRSEIEHRDITDGTFNERGRVVSGTLKDPYTGEKIEFSDSERPHDLEHLVALGEIHRSEDPSNPLTPEERDAIANDPKNLLLVESGENRYKSDKDAKDYLPSYKPSQCRFAISTIEVKHDYGLTVDKGEYEALSKVLDNKCTIE